MQYSFDIVKQLILYNFGQIRRILDVFIVDSISIGLHDGGWILV